jgi:predicted nucleotidyltransferase
MFDRDSAISTVKQFVAQCQLQEIHFDKVILFGSTLRNEATEDSDIDVLLASRQFGVNQWDNLGLIARVNKKFYRIEPHTFPTDYFLKGDPFINEIKKTGLEIVI